jgi:ketosteroid isomerase-like protein
MLSISSARSTSEVSMASSSNTSRQSAQENLEIVATDRAWEDAITHRDVSEMTRLASDDLIYTHANSIVEDKAGFIDHIVNGRLRFLAVEYEDIAVRVHGNMGLLTCALHLDTLDDANVKGELHFRTTHVWILTDGRWQLLANQSTYLARH